LRLLIDTLIAVMLVAVLAGILVYGQAERRELDRYQAVHNALAQLQEQAVYHCNANAASPADGGFPHELSPEWFSHKGLPRNIMLAGRQPWLDVAPAGDLNEHPPDPIVRMPDQAGFWYNPNLGVVRARVGWTGDIHAALELYNRLNGSSLVDLPVDDPLRRPHLVTTSAVAAPRR